jgi:hypothetical protein
VGDAERLTRAQRRGRSFGAELSARDREQFGEHASFFGHRGCAFGQLARRAAQARGPAHVERRGERARDHATQAP